MNRDEWWGTRRIFSLNQLKANTHFHGSCEVIRAVVWKELREQGLIALVLVVLGAALLIAAAALADPPVPNAAQTDVIASLGMGRLLTLMLIVTAGMVCGGALFAAEKEAGTMAFLETLPTARRALWLAKISAGLVLAGSELVILLGTGVGLGLVSGSFLDRLMIYGLLAFAWGTFGSTLARTTLGSVGIAIPTAALAMFVFLIPISVFMSHPGSGMPRKWGWLLFELLMVITPLALSLWRFTALDRRRAADATNSMEPCNTDQVSLTRHRSAWGNLALVWLALRQLRLPGTVLSLFALAFGLTFLLPDMRAIFVWPALALTAGVLAGLTAFGDEQTHRTSLFWSDMRLPIGRAWWVKIGIHLALLGWLLFLVALPSWFRAEFAATKRYEYGHSLLSAVFKSRLFEELGSQGWKYLFVPAVYGFVFGHVCSLFFRKLVVACGVAMMLGGVGAVAWGPSLLAGGVSHWQLWLPAGAVLFTGRWLIRPWISDRMLNRGPLYRLAGGLAATVVLLGLALGYRAVQVPEVAGNTDDLEFIATLPNYDENIGGREFRVAAERYARTVAAIPRQTRVQEQRRPRFEERLESAVRYGWPGDDPELATWLDAIYTNPHAAQNEPAWFSLAEVAATHRVGVYNHPQLVTTTAATSTALDNARAMSFALLARGLQQQVHGNPTAFVAAFRTVILLARTLRYGGGVMSLETSIEVERVALHAADRWLERLGKGHADLTLAVARTTAEGDDTKPFDLRPHLLADRFVIRGMMLAPSQFLTTILTPPHGLSEQSTAEADLVALAWTVPWEKERTRRLIGLAPTAFRTDTQNVLLGRPGIQILLGRNQSQIEMKERDTQLCVLRRAMILKAAIRTYQSDHGGPPANREELVTRGYLASLPIDPFADEGGPFGYRVSTGETLRGPTRTAPQGRTSEETALLPVGSGSVIIWSVGMDKIDQGGRVPPGGPRSQDIVFLVPPPAPE